jgi:hypothetical protein
MATSATQVKNMRILLRRDSAANWTQRNPLLLKGEAGIETDEKGMKMGDGTSRWNDLPYFVGFETLDGGSPAGYMAQEMS